LQSVRIRLVSVSKGFGNRVRQRGKETYKQELQLIQVARIRQAGRVASITAGAHVCVYVCVGGGGSAGERAAHCTDCHAS
jgi:hypothetical protein